MNRLEGGKLTWQARWQAMLDLGLIPPGSQSLEWQVDSTQQELWARVYEVIEQQVVQAFMNGEYSHHWSGWPGAICLNCGQEDSTEICIAECADSPYLHQRGFCQKHPLTVCRRQVDATT